jgi:hypothetical protein
VGRAVRRLREEGPRRPGRRRPALPVGAREGVRSTRACPPGTLRRPAGRAVRPDIRIARPVREYRDPFVVPYEPDGQVLSYRVSACPETAFQLAIRQPSSASHALVHLGVPGISSPCGPLVRSRVRRLDLAPRGPPEGRPIVRRTRRSACTSPQDQRTPSGGSWSAIRTRKDGTRTFRGSIPRGRLPIRGHLRRGGPRRRLTVRLD